MKFLIWGAGLRGRRVRYFLADRAVAYIDSNAVLQGKRQDSLPILSFEEYLQNSHDRYQDAWIIISPRSTSFIDGIVRQLDARGVVKYFRLQDAFASYYEYDANEMIEQIERQFSKKGAIHLLGLDCSHADIYTRLLMLLNRCRRCRRNAGRISRDFPMSPSVLTGCGANARRAGSKRKEKAQIAVEKQMPTEGGHAWRLCRSTKCSAASA